METIYSLVTKPINQNIAVIRISGPQAFELLNIILKKPTLVEANKVEYSKFYFEDKFIDEGLILKFKSPNSFTGEDVIEIQTHGSMYVVDEILKIFSKSKLARQALPGEFTKQAFLNNKMDLTKASAINSLITSENNIVANRSKLNINGKQNQFINKMISSLENIISRLQVAIDYPENTDLEEFSFSTITKLINENIKIISKIVEESKQIQRINDGITIAIVGKPNVGKSTLINKILGEDRVIVSDIQGTTRDVVDIKLKINDVMVTLKDTAGIRDKTNDIIEIMGIEKSKQSIIDSDLVLFLQDFENFSTEIPELLKEHNAKLIKVITKWDLAPNEKAIDDYVKISSKNDDIKDLLDSIAEYIKSKLPENTNNDTQYLTDKDQINMFEEINENLVETLSILNSGFSDDYILSNLESSLEILYKLIGKKMDPDYINNLFGSFCLGK